MSGKVRKAEVRHLNADEVAARFGVARWVV